MASTLDNAVFAIHDAARTSSDQGTGTLIYEDAVHLHGALAMAMAPNGHLVVSDNDLINANPNQPSELVEFTVEGQFVKEVSVDPNLGGSFGLAISGFRDMSKLAAVDDNTDMLLIWTLPLP